MFVICSLFQVGLFEAGWLFLLAFHVTKSMNVNCIRPINLIWKVFSANGLCLHVIAIYFLANEMLWRWSFKVKQMSVAEAGIAGNRESMFHQQFPIGKYQNNEALFLWMGNVAETLVSVILNSPIPYYKKRLSLTVKVDVKNVLRIILKNRSRKKEDASLKSEWFGQAENKAWVLGKQK